MLSQSRWMGPDKEIRILFLWRLPHVLLIRKPIHKPVCDPPYSELWPNGENGKADTWQLAPICVNHFTATAVRDEMGWSVCIAGNRKTIQLRAISQSLQIEYVHFFDAVKLILLCKGAVKTSCDLSALTLFTGSSEETVTSKSFWARRSEKFNYLCVISEFWFILICYTDSTWDLVTGLKGQQL